jgi:nitroimidazol reductase NimA-like FMN-containing flavoprotein (pyridoxamine 5'-phosphate oxidase superfamily)
MKAIPFTPMRRADRAVNDDAWIRAMLQAAPTGVLAVAGRERPVVNTNLFAFAEDEGAIYFHTAHEGLTRVSIEANNYVCFTVSQMGRLLPADTAKGMSVEFASVVVYGRAEIVEDIEEARRGLQLLLDKYFPHLRPGRDYRSIEMDEAGQATVYRIRIEEWSGKRKQAPEDFPGAFSFPDKMSSIAFPAEG